MRRFPSLLILCLLIAVSAIAEVPVTITYQGRLTDASGTPVADGNYTLDFALYDAASGGTLLWSETGDVVTPSDGLFATVLGDNTPFPQSPEFGFEAVSPFVVPNTTLWLEITVDGELQSPRTQLHSVPYAQAARDLGGQSEFDPLRGIRTNSEFSTYQAFGGLSGTEKVRLWGPASGELLLFGNGDTLMARMSAGGFSGGELELRRPNDPSKRIFLDAGATGDFSAVLQENAVNSLEMLNEPGIAQEFGYSNAFLVRSSTSQDIGEVTITTPADGYVLVTGDVSFAIDYNGNPTRAQVYLQISETSNAPQDIGFDFVTIGASFNTTTNTGYRRLHYVSLSRVFFVAAGTHTFYVQGNMTTLTDASVDATTFGPPTRIRALYLPTSYGAIESSPGSLRPASANARVERGIDPMTGEMTEYVVEDLRQLEMEALRKRNEALEAELRLREAQRRAEREELEKGVTK